MEEHFFSQTHEDTPSPPPDDLIIQIANAESTSEIRSFSSIIADNYPNVLLFDLVQHQSPGDYLSWPVGDTLAGVIPDSTFLFEGLTFNITGRFQLIPLETESLIINYDTLTNIQRFHLIETYFLISDGDTIASYKNTYFSFFDKSSNQLVFEVFNKNRYLKGGIHYPFNGISYPSGIENNHSTINLTTTPNPSDTETCVHFDLWKSGLTVISISNQNAALNEVVFSDYAIAGSNNIIIPTRKFVAGTYVISVMFENKHYSTSLIIL